MCRDVLSNSRSMSPATTAAGRQRRCENDAHYHEVSQRLECWGDQAYASISKHDVGQRDARRYCDDLA